MLILPRRRAPRLRIALLVMPAGLGLLGLGGGFARLQEFGLAILPALSGLVLLGLGLWRWFSESSRQVALYPDGIAIRMRGRTRILRYAGVAETRLEVRRIRGSALFAALVARSRRDQPRKAVVRVRIAGGGTTLELDHHDEGVLAAYRRVLAEVNPRLIRDGLQVLGTGGTLRFGRVSLTREQISFGRRVMHVSSLQRIVLRNGRLTLKCRDRWLRPGLRIDRIPNFWVLTGLLSRLSEGNLSLDPLQEAQLDPRLL